MESLCGYAIICLLIRLLIFGLFPILSQYDHSCMCVHTQTHVCVDISFHLFSVNRNEMGDRWHIFNILTNCLFYKILLYYFTFPSAVFESSVCCIDHRGLVFLFLFLIWSNLIDVQEGLVVLICIFLMTSALEHLFLTLFSFHVSVSSLLLCCICFFNWTVSVVEFG